MFKRYDKDYFVVKTSDTLLELMVWAFDERYRTGHDLGYPICRKELLRSYENNLKESSIDGLSDAFNVKIEIRLNSPDFSDIYGQYKKKIVLHYDRTCDKYNLLSKSVNNTYVLISDSV